MPTGTVKFFDGDRGFGFIETDASDDDVFFHVTDLDGAEPEEGQELEFEILPSNRGPRADEIRLL